MKGFGEMQRWETVRNLLTPTERTAISNGLRVAAERFDDDAKAVAEAPRVADQFKRQAAESRRIADAVEP